VLALAYKDGRGVTSGYVRRPRPYASAELTALEARIGRRAVAKLHLSVNTVKGYTKSLYRKLGVAARADAVARGRGLGLI